MKRISNIGDYLDLEKEAEYPCSDGGVTYTVNVDNLLDAQLQQDREDFIGWLTKHGNQQQVDLFKQEAQDV